MLKVDVKIKMPDLTIKPPTSTTFWKRVALQTQLVIRHRTESQIGADGRTFRHYSRDYLRKKIKGKVSKPGGGFYGPRSGKVDLSLSTRMLASMKSIGKRTRAIIRLTGEQGFKAWVNELSGRTFFALSQKDADRINNQVADQVAKENKLKKR